MPRAYCLKCGKRPTECTCTERPTFRGKRETARPPRAQVRPLSEEDSESLLRMLRRYGAPSVAAALARHMATLKYSRSQVNNALGLLKLGRDAVDLLNRFTGGDEDAKR